MVLQYNTCSRSITIEYLDEDDYIQPRSDFAFITINDKCSFLDTSADATADAEDDHTKLDTLLEQLGDFSEASAASPSSAWTWSPPAKVGIVTVTLWTYSAV